MRSLNSKFELPAFFAQLREASERVLFLDYDGTLAPFHADPRLAFPYPRACSVLRGVISVPGTRVVIVSGRRLEDLRAPLALIPHNEVWASHGWEHVVAGRISRRVPTAEARKELARAETLAQPLLRDGARIEVKIASVAVHWRGLPDATAARVRLGVCGAWELLERSELGLLPFDGGMEARARGRNKGDAVSDVLSSCDVGAACAYLGDDLADEDAFKAIRGRGLSVLVREHHRSTQADLWLSHPRELTDFLERWQPAM